MNDAELAEHYGWIDRALPANALSDFVRSRAHRISRLAAAGLVAVKNRVNAIALAPKTSFVAIPTFSALSVEPGVRSKRKVPTSTTTYW